MNTRILSPGRLGLGLLVACAVVATSIAPLAGQTSTGSVRGYVTDSSGAPLEGARVIAVNVQTSARREATTQARGFYAMLGLEPAQYEVTARQLGMAPQKLRVRVLIGEVYPLDFRLAASAIEVEAVTVAVASGVETRTSEVATNVTQQQIERLPTPSRNFLDLAALAPGTQVTIDRLDGTSKTFSSGAQGPEGINIFIDGASLKNDVLAGGVAGQQDSRGNPFPRNAVQEFRIITQNYKAEYQKASSAVITATTRSGTNEWQGSAFFSGMGEGLVDRSDIDKAAGIKKGDLSRYLVGGSFGGPIQQDRLFLFASYEGNYQSRQGRTAFLGDPATWPAPLQAQNGELHTSPFRSSLLFGKLTYDVDPRQSLELSGNLRHETDVRGFSNIFACSCQSFENAENFKNDVGMGVLKHKYRGQTWLNEAAVSFQRYKYNPNPVNFDLPASEYEGLGRIGGKDTPQNFTQDRLSLRNDFTHSGLQWNGSHVLKFGANVDFLRYHVVKQLLGNPVFHFRASDNFAFPYFADYGAGNPDLSAHNTQIGVYAQDDWSPTQRFTVNLGIRWDYESDMLNNNYVTPQNVRDSLSGLVPPQYFTDGTQRPAFTGAFQPRIGLSYSLDEQGKTTLFGGIGLFYDRDVYNNALDEKFRRQWPIYRFDFDNSGSPPPGYIAWDPSLMSRQALDGLIASGQAGKPQIFLVDNNTRPPRSTQWSLGIRRVLGQWLASASYTGVRSYHGFTFGCGNLTGATPDKKPPNCDVPLAAAYGPVFISHDNLRTWYDALYVRIERPYTRTGARGWGGGLAWTFGKATKNGGDLFSLDFPNPDNFGRFRTGNDQRHTVVLNWIADVPYVAGIQFSGLITLGSGTPFDIGDASTGTYVLRRGEGDPEKFNFIIPSSWAYRNVDLHLRKDFPALGRARWGITADLFNAFNYQNYGCFNSYIPTLPATNSDFGKPGCVITDGRRVQLGTQVDF